MRKVFAVLLCWVMLAAVWSVPAFASFWDEGNDGRNWDTAYVINSAEDLKSMISEDIFRNHGISRYYKLTADIDLTSETNWGTNRSFYGHFDGQNHTIKVNINKPTSSNVSPSDLSLSDYACLFPVISGTIKNLNVTGTLTGPGAAGLVYLGAGTIENCNFNGTIEATIAEAGGLIANLAYGGNVRNCKVTGKVSASYSAGGIAGFMSGGSINNCSATGVTLSKATYLGGIVGTTKTSSNRDFYNEVKGNLSGNTWPSQYPEIGNRPDSTTPAPGGDTPSTPGDTPSAPAAPVSPDTPASPTPDDTPSGNDVPYTPPVAPAPQNDDSGQASPLPRGTIQPVTLTQSVLEKVARAVSTDISHIHTLTASNIAAPQEPTQDMRDYIKGDNAELIGKLNTLSVNQSGYYVFKVTLTDELFEQVKGQKVSGFKFYGLHDSEAQARASFITGFLNTLEVLTMTGDAFDSFGVREFLMVGLLDAGTPFSVYLTKIILALLAGGCSSGIFAGSLAVITLSILLLLRKH